MKLHTAGEDYLEAVLILQKKLGMVRTTGSRNTGRYPVHAVSDKDREIRCGNYYGYAGQRPLLSDGTKLDFYSVWNRIRFPC